MDSIKIPQGQSVTFEYAVTAGSPPAPLDLTNVTLVAYLGWTQQPQLVELTEGDGITVNTNRATGLFTVNLTGQETAQVSSRLGRAYRYELWGVNTNTNAIERIDAIGVVILDSWAWVLS